MNSQVMARRSEPRPELKLRFSSRALEVNRTDGVFDVLKEAILTQTLPGGTPLIEQQLAEEFGISKTPVREALLRLAKEGLVKLENARGASVVSLTSDEMRDIFEMRLHLEPLALEQGMKSLDQVEWVKLEKLLQDAKQAITRKDFAKLSRLNIAFHRGLYVQATNQLLVHWLDGLSDRRRLLSVQGWQRQNRSREEWQEHRLILEAVKAGDVRLAKKRLTDHIKRFSQLVSSQLDT